MCVCLPVFVCLSVCVCLLICLSSCLLSTWIFLSVCLCVFSIPLSVSLSPAIGQGVMGQAPVIKAICNILVSLGEQCKNLRRENTFVIVSHFSS